MGILNILKKLPIDMGQANLRTTTKGKLIALSYVPQAAPGQNALDVGCREGNQSRWLEGKGYHVTSVDVERAYEKCIVLDANKKLPFKDESFNLIWCSEVIEHLDNPAFSINEFRRVLKKGGRLIVTTPNSYFWIGRLFNLIGVSPAKMQNPGHKQFFRFDDVRALFPNAHMFGYFPYVLVKRKISRGIGMLSPTFVIIEDKKEEIKKKN